MTTPTGAGLVDHVGELVTCDPQREDGPLGRVRDAAVVVEDGRVAWVGPASRAPAAAHRCRGPVRAPGVR